MSETYTITLDTEEESWEENEVEVELTEPNPLLKMELASEAPMGIADIDENKPGSIPSGTMQWVKLMVDTISSFPKEMMSELSADNLDRLIQSTMYVFGGEKPPEPKSYKYEPEDDVPTFDMMLDEDGTVDVEEWR